MFVDLAAASLDVFVGKREQRRRHFEGERLYTEFEQPSKYEADAFLVGGVVGRAL